MSEEPAPAPDALSTEDAAAAAADDPGDPSNPGDPGNPGSTGHPAVDAALRAVVQAADADPTDQLPAYQAAHRTLRETLATVDEQ